MKSTRRRRVHVPSYLRELNLQKLLSKRFLLSLLLSLVISATVAVTVAQAQTSTMVDGVYTISNKNDTNKVLDISGASTESGGNVQFYSDNESVAQRFVLTSAGDGYYTIRNINSNKMVDVAYAGQTAGTNVWQYTANGTDAQLWQPVLTGDGDGSYYLVSKCNGLYLDVLGGGTRDGTNIQVYTGNGTNAQKFYLNEISPVVEDGIYILTPQCASGKVVDVRDGSHLDGVRLQLYTPNDTLAQRFQLTYDDSTGYYSIANVGSGKMLDVMWANPNSGTDVWQYVANGTIAQRWSLKGTSSNLVIYSATGNGNCLDVRSAGTADGTAIQIYTPNGTPAQSWSLSSPPVPTYTVTFTDWDDSLLGPTQTVASGSAAVAPASPTRASDAEHSYVFAGWDTSFDNVTSNLVVKATYMSTLLADDLVATVGDMYVAYDGSSLKLSVDDGTTFGKSLSIVGISPLKYVHLFTNGSILFADQTKCYYSTDWKTYSESTVLNSDGSTFTPTTAVDNFSCYTNDSVPQVVNGEEMLVWGNYSTENGMQFTSNMRVWYTTDYGATVKEAFAFNTSSTWPARHIHAVDFNPYDNTFWVQTGDEPVNGVDMSHWIKGSYDTATDTWIWTEFASGLDFKTLNMVFTQDGGNNYVYWSWDKTPGGVVRAPYATMGDVLSHEWLLQTSSDCLYVVRGKSGDIVALQGVWNSSTELPRVLYYAPDGVNFVRIVGTMPSAFDSLTDAQYWTWTYNSTTSRILAGVWSLSSQSCSSWDRLPNVFVDDAIRNSGYPSALE